MAPPYVTNPPLASFNVTNPLVARFMISRPSRAGDVRDETETLINQVNVVCIRAEAERCDKYSSRDILYPLP